MKDPEGIDVAVVQLAWQEPGECQRDRTAALAETAIRRGADVVVLPELAVPGYTTDPAVLERSAEPLSGATVRAWHEAVAGTGAYIVGGFCERAGGQLFNTAVVVSAEGVILHYRKAHLFGEERRVFARGDLGFPVVETSVGKIGVCVCYDLRFVEVARLLALRGAALICVPAAWVGGYDQGVPAAERWPGQVNGLLTQANLNQVFIAAASFAGDRFLGNSVIADPYGTPVAGPLIGVHDVALSARVDLGGAMAAQHRSSLINPREDRRSDLYSIEYRGQRY
jgi:predicted amidohydrolase